jgi:hypothetical protein
MILPMFAPPVNIAHVDTQTRPIAKKLLPHRAGGPLTMTLSQCDTAIATSPTIAPPKKNHLKPNPLPAV